MESKQDFKTLQDGTQKSLVSTVKAVNRVAAEDLTFQRTINPAVADQLDGATTRLLDLSSRLLKSAASACGLSSPVLEETDDIDLNWPAVVDIVDTALEKADTALDEYTGLIKRKEPPTSDNMNKAPDFKKSRPSPKVVRNANIAKPQTTFDVQPDNFSTGPWKPILTSKPHASVPLEKSLVITNGADGSPQYKHPYEVEISTAEYPSRVFEKSEPIPFQPMDQSEPTWVDTYEGVLDMLNVLKGSNEIAVDLEHHDFRTYTGIVCLMQISTRERDWIVDTLQPWRHKLQVLNEVFADPRIIKVFHGAYMDMIWLQRDLGLYVNGLFDTYFACELLAYPGRSLAYLLSTFAGFTADKQYQLADWRMRPIPPEMMYYARSDTHYLLYIYDRVRNDLVSSSDRSNPETDLIRRALDKSREVSLYRHELAEFNEATGEGTRGWYGYILKNSHLTFDAEQFAVFRGLWQWRDATARSEDENPNFVLGSSTVAQIARVNPPDAMALRNLLPLSHPTARSRFNDIWKHIQKTKAQGGPSLLHFLTSLAPESLKRNGAPKAATKNTATMPVVDDDEVEAPRMERSQLFGDMPISTRWEKPKQTLQRQNDRIPFPWQRFVQSLADIGVQDSEPEMTTETADADGVAAPGAEMMDEPDQEFTLKRGRKRKDGPAQEEEESPEEDDAESHKAGVSDGVLALDDDEPKRRQLNKKARKQERRAIAKQERISSENGQETAQRQALKEQRREAKSQRKAEKKKEGEQRYAAVPFDYSKAATVMDATRGGEEGEASGAVAERRKKDKARVFDPYLKSAEEGVKGARKAPPIRGERSGTFKK